MHHTILVCAYTNAAVDNLVEGFIGAGLKPLRIGFRGKIKDSLTKHTLDYKLDQHPLKPKVDTLLEEQSITKKKRLDLRKRIEALQRAPTARAAGRLDQMRSTLLAQERRTMAVAAKLYAIHQEMLRDTTADADVVRIYFPRSFCALTSCVRFVQHALRRPASRLTYSTFLWCFLTKHPCQRSRHLSYP